MQNMEQKKRQLEESQDALTEELTILQAQGQPRKPPRLHLQLKPIAQNKSSPLCSLREKTRGVREGEGEGGHQ